MDGPGGWSSRAWFCSGIYVDAKFEGLVSWNVCRKSPDVAKKGVTPSGDDVSDVGETRAIRDRDIGDIYIYIYNIYIYIYHQCHDLG